MLFIVRSGGGRRDGEADGIMLTIVRRQVSSASGKEKALFIRFSFN